ncbi:LuxR C-terminal-related transcriptional regulator [Streptomyces sp. SCA3-4]|uniref:helix-turn-helix domain-containing protein n=1 Tax=Streptomyces sichuanensis TaxID=2871810 RepID=UPI001CE3479A|nr:helix-turn-helix transcriptional regulator [Streptomyces sichuanensis]MCA6095468.1 LuxR C-terminal-related transcriptional regulator [Streptomyces sichuanensis]
MTEQELQTAITVLHERGLVLKPRDGRLPRLVSPEATLSRLIELQRSWHEQAVTALGPMRSAIDALGESAVRLATGHLQACTVRGQEQITKVLHDAAYRAREEIVSLHPGAPLPPDVLEDSRLRNQRVLDRGVRMRSVYLKSMVRVPHGQAHVRAMQRAGAEVRLAVVLPLRLIVVDRLLAFTSLRNREGEAVALQLQGPELGDLLHQVFEFCWLSAEPVDGPGPDLPSQAEGPPGMSGRELTIVRMLFEGRKDESIARALGVSVRTLRRLMTDVMQKLGAETRFQAGVRAVKLGLVGEPAMGEASCDAF